METVPLKVGELARRSGLSVRTLHYYDEIGLLEPSHHSAAGHRLYGAADVARLQQIVSLRQLGFSLDEIGGCLDRTEFSLRAVIEMHVNRLRERIAHDRGLCERLERVAGRLSSREEVSVEELIETIEVTNMFDKYFTQEQRRELDGRRKAVGDARIQQAQAEWAQLIAEVREAMDRSDDPASEPVRRLADRWRGVVREFSGGNRAIEASVGKLYAQEPSVGKRFRIDQEMMEFVARASAGNDVAD